MALKSTPQRTASVKGAPALTREDFLSATAALGANMVELSKATGIHRQYLSEFKNGSRNLQPALLRQLREYFEAQGIEFAETDESAGNEEMGDSGPEKSKRQPGEAFAFPVSFISDQLTSRQREDLLKRISANEARAAVILKKSVEYGFFSGLLGDVEPSEEAESTYAELLAIYADTYLAIRALHGTSQIKPLSPQLAEKNTEMPTFAELLDSRHVDLLKLISPRGRTADSKGNPTKGGESIQKPAVLG